MCASLVANTETKYFGIVFTCVAFPKKETLQTHTKVIQLKKARLIIFRFKIQGLCNPFSCQQLFLVKTAPCKKRTLCPSIWFSSPSSLSLFLYHPHPFTPVSPSQCDKEIEQVQSQLEEYREPPLSLSRLSLKQQKFKTFKETANVSL